ncbi:hypothetical protein ACV3VT_03730 [Legionella pneumophila]
MTLGATVLVAEKFVFSASTKNDRVQLFQIVFRKTDGSIFINFPYQPENSSFLSKITLKAGQLYPNTINVKSGGKVTIHKVKFSHHLDGRSHFSQDKKIYTKIINNAATLTDHNGHLFTMHLGGIAGFNKIPIDTHNSNDKKTFYDIQMPEFFNLKFTAYWYNDTYLKQHLKEYNSKGGPVMFFKRKNGTDLKGVMIENTFIKGNNNYYLFLGFEIDTKLTKKDKPSIVFIGGFEHTTISLDHKQDTSFLMLTYPTNENYHNLINEIGTVDIQDPLF